MSSFPWLDATPPKKDGSARRAKVAAEELAHRAALFFRLGFSQKQATHRLTTRIAWEFDQPSTGHHRRPDELSDAAIAKIVHDTYARRPNS
jgi:hypothetical protein